MLIVNNAFVYLHLPKTGGTFVTDMFQRIASESENFTVLELPGLKHSGTDKIPEEFRNLQIVTNVRNVFEHYVSRYTFRWWADPSQNKRRFKMDRVTDSFPRFPDITFSEFLRLFNGWSFHARAPKVVNLLAGKNIGYNSWDLIRLCVEKRFQLIKGLGEFNCKTVRNRIKRIRFLRTETLNVDICNLLKEYEVDDELIDEVLEAPPILPKKGGRGIKEMTWHKYYSQDDIDFVFEKDRLYFSLFPDMKPK